MQAPAGSSEGAGREELPASGALEEALGQTVRQALDLAGWGEGAGLEQLFARLEKAAARSAEEEGRLRRRVRAEVLGQLGSFPDAPEGAGVYSVPERLVRDARRNVLLAGNLTAVDGASTVHEGVTATLVAVGVSLVRYDGVMHSWRNTFLRQDYDLGAPDPVNEIRNILSRQVKRWRRAAGKPDEQAGRDEVTYLLQRGFMAAAERKALLERACTRWRMGHGTPAPLELLTGSGSMALLDEMLPVLEALVLGQTRWVFLPEGLGGRALRTLAGALEPGEVGVFQRGRPALEEMVRTGTYDPVRKRRAQAFAARAGEACVVGGYRATPQAPGQLFVAHAGRALEAGLLALADAGLQPHRGYPLVLELAGLNARAGLGVEGFQGLVEAVYARARAGWVSGVGYVAGGDR